MKKINVDFVAHNEPVIKDIANAQLIELMVSITRIGLRVDNYVNNDIMEKESNHG